jgi:hypothetical protein
MSYETADFWLKCKVQYVLNLGFFSFPRLPARTERYVRAGAGIPDKHISAKKTAAKQK